MHFNVYKSGMCAVMCKNYNEQCCYSDSVNTTPKGKTEHYHLQLVCASQIMIHYAVEERILTRVHFYTCIIKKYVEDIRR